MYKVTVPFVLLGSDEVDLICFHFPTLLSNFIVTTYVDTFRINKKNLWAMM